MDQLEVITTSPPNFGVRVEHLDTSRPLSQDEMYVRCNFELPDAPPDGFAISMPGRANRWVQVSELDSTERVERTLVLECAGNGRTFMDPVPEGTPWTLGGISPIAVSGLSVLDVVGDIPESVVELVFTGADSGSVEPEGDINYQFSLDVDSLDSALLVTHIGGAPLTIEHGAPVRLIVPGQYAMKSVKWITQIEGVTKPFEGHFVKKYRYFDDTTEPEEQPVGDIAVRSLITNLTEGTKATRGQLIEGLAWSASSIHSVEVSFDGGDTWRAAEISGAVAPGAATEWKATLDTETGMRSVKVRARDSNGNVQPDVSRWNRNGYANNVTHSVRVEVVNPS